MLDIDLSVFEMSVDMLDEEVDLSNLAETDPKAAAEVQSFATDISLSFATSVSSSLGVSAESVEVICSYRVSDTTKLDLLTLEGSCGSSRILKGVNFLQERRLQVGGFGVEIEILGDAAVQATNDAQDNDKSITETLASMLASLQVIIESDLLPVGLTIEAGVGEISVAVAKQASAPDPTSSTKAPEAQGSSADGDEPNAEKMTGGPLTLEAKEKTAPEKPAPPSSPPSIARVALIASFVLFVLGAVCFWRHEKKTWRPVEYDHPGQTASRTLHLTIHGVGPDGVQITIGNQTTDVPTATDESSFSN